MTWSGSVPSEITLLVTEVFSLAVCLNVDSDSELLTGLDESILRGAYPTAVTYLEREVLGRKALDGSGRDKLQIEFPEGLLETCCLA